MNDRQAYVRIFNAGALSAVALDHQEPAIDLLPPVHASGIFLPDETAFREADPVQFDRIAFEPEDIAEFSTTLRDAEAEPMLKPA